MKHSFILRTLRCGKTTKMVKLEAQEWYYGMLSPEDLTTYLTQTGDFLVRCWDAGNGLSLYLSCKFEKISTATATGTTMTTKENVTQNEENEEVGLEKTVPCVHICNFRLNSKMGVARSGIMYSASSKIKTPSDGL